MAKRRSNPLSMLAETAEEYIKLECARRRNQPSTRRRSMLQEQFRVQASSSRLKERVSQARRHEFLSRADNKEALAAILDRVRDLTAEDLTPRAAPPTPTGRSGRRGSITGELITPMERGRLSAWASDTERVLRDFTPSDNHANDPILRVVEQLQVLQDGPVCFAEVIADARALLERWDREGLFDNDSAGVGELDYEDEDAYDFGDELQRAQTPMASSYAYQNVRQRAAAHCIKRNIVRWVRAMPSFCERVAEIELFGRSTENWLKDLTSTAGSAAAAAEGHPDIFSMVKGRYADRLGSSIALADLLKFAQHVATFPVDEAIRSVEDIARKRRLLDLRCAVKIQWAWRKARGIFQARRMLRAVEQLRQQREREAREARELALLHGQAQPQTPRGKRKASRPAAKKTRNSIAAAVPEQPAARSLSSRSTDHLEGSPSPALSGRVRASVMATKRKESKANKPDGSTRSPPEIDTESASDIVDDEADRQEVENAWQAFLDSVSSQGGNTTEQHSTTGQDADQTEANETVNDQKLDNEPTNTESHSTEDDWRNWSDGEDAPDTKPEPNTDEEHHRVSTVRVVSVVARGQVVEAAATEQPAQANAEALDMDELPSLSTRRLASREVTSVRPLRGAAKVSALELMRRLEQRPRVDIPSTLVPFADWGQTSQVGVPPTSELSPPVSQRDLVASPKASKSPRHLHEMDFQRSRPIADVVESILASFTDRQPVTSTDPVGVLPVAKERRQDVVRTSRESPRRDTKIQQVQQNQQKPSHPQLAEPSVRVYRSNKLDDRKWTLSKDSTTVESDKQMDPSATQTLNRFVYKHQGNRESVLVKRQGDSTTSVDDGRENADMAAIREQLAAHSEWMRTMEAKPSVSAAIPTRPPSFGTSRMPMSRKRRTRLSTSITSREDEQYDEEYMNARLPSSVQRAPDPVIVHPSSEVALAQSLETSRHTSSPRTPGNIVPQVERRGSTLMPEIQRSLKFRTQHEPDVNSEVSPRGAAQETDVSTTRGTVRSPSRSSNAQSYADVSEFDTRFADPVRPSSHKRKWRLPTHSVETPQQPPSNTRVSGVSAPVDTGAVQHVKTASVIIDVHPRHAARTSGGKVKSSKTVRKATIQPSPSKKTSPPTSATVEPVYETPTVSYDAVTGPMSSVTSMMRKASPPSVQAMPTESRPAGPLPSPFPAPHDEAVPTAVWQSAIPVEPPTDPARAAAFNKLLLQYLGLLQCAPPRP